MHHVFSSSLQIITSAPTLIYKMSEFSFLRLPEISRRIIYCVKGNTTRRSRVLFEEMITDGKLKVLK
jgi:hypothetical protein